MTLAILILAHLIYSVKVFDGIVTQTPRGLFTGLLLTLLCWQHNTVWGIVTLCYTIVLYLVLVFIKLLND